MRKYRRALECCSVKFDVNAQYWSFSTEYAPHVYEKPYHPSQVSVQHRAASERFRAIMHTIDDAQADLALEAYFCFQRA